MITPKRTTWLWAIVAAALAGACLSAVQTTLAAEPAPDELDWTKAPLTKIYGAWKHVSPTSAVLYFQSDGLARSYVEYGPTAKYGKKTATTEKAGFGHLHRITGLATGATCHYRLVCVGADGKTLTSDDATFTPAAIEGAIALPGDLAGPPYVLDKDGATYVLTADIAAEAGVAVEIKAKDVTLDLDGHTVTYNTTFEKTNFLRNQVSKARGVVLTNAADARLLNGTIRQGSATATAAAMDIVGSNNPELAGLTIETLGDSAGVYSMWGFGGGRIHHNLCLDKAENWITYGSYWNPRACISISATGVKVDHNVVRGTNRLIRTGRGGSMNDATGAEVFENDLHLDAKHYTAVALTLNVRSGVARDNRIICTGYPATGIMLPDCASRYAQVYSNRIKVHPTSPQSEGADKAPWDLGVGITAACGTYGLNVYDNTILVYGGKYDQGEGGFVGNGVRFINMMFDNTESDVHDNRITAIAKDGQLAACVVVTGGSQANTLRFRNNRLISNRCHVILSDRTHSIQAKGEMDGGRNARFIGNTLVRLGESSDFQTVRCGDESIDSYAYMLDTAFEGGAGWGSVAFTGKSGVRELRVGKAATLTVKDASGKPIWDAAVTLESADAGRVYVAGTTTGPDGKVELPVVEYLLTPKGKVPLTGMKFAVSKAGLRSAELPAANLPKEVTLGKDGDDPEQTIAKLRDRFPDKAAPEGDWDWMRAPLKTIKGDDLYASVNSACAYWQTDGRAWSYVEYGPTAKYGSKTAPHPKPNFAHLHHLRGLDSGAEYHYRLVSVGVDGKRIVSADRAFETGSGDGLAKLPGEAKGPPFVIDQPGNYLLTEDVTVAEGDAIVIKAEGVVIDLNGHTVTYGTAPPPAKPARGIVAENIKAKGPRILNGIVREGPHDAARSNAVTLRACNGYEIGWVRVEIRSFLTSALAVPWAGERANIHHNLLWDRGHSYANRHQGCRTIAMGNGGIDAKVHHNIIVSARNRAIDGGSRNVEVFENSIELLGHSTNCSGIGMTGHGHKIHHNLIEAHGEHPCAIWGWRDNKIYANKLQAEADMCISYEYGPLGGNGFRTNYDYQKYDGMEFYDNLVVVRAYENEAHGFWSSRSWLFWLANIGAGNRVSIRNNTLVSMVYGDCTTVGLGLSSNSANLVFEGNRIISNYLCVSFGTHRGSAENVKWVANTFVKVGDDPRFRTFGTARSNFTGNILTDSRFEGGAKIEFGSSSNDKGDLTFNWYLDVVTAPAAAVTVKDKNGKEVFSGTADEKGKLRATITGQVVGYAGGGKVSQETLTPHTVTVTKDGKTASRTVTADKSQSITIRP